MMMDDESWRLVKHTNKVTGFVEVRKSVLLQFLT
jgi:transcription antitermination factor NusG